MNRRRELLAAFAASLLAPPRARAQSAAKLRKIGVLWQTPPPPPEHPNLAMLLKGLKNFGWEDGRTVTIEYRYGANDPDRLARFAAELSRLNVDVITTAGDLSTRAAQQATATIPIVAVAGFPADSGFVKSLARPGGNITGVAVLSDELSAKRLEMMKEILPRLSRVAVLWDPVTHERQPKAAAAAARGFGLQVEILSARSADELAGAFKKAGAARADALLVLVSPAFTGNRATLVSLAERYRLPAMYPNATFVDSGGLITYGFATEEIWRLAAASIDRILKGARAAELPVQQPTQFELVVNLKTARALGLAIPRSVLQRAERVIE